MYPSDGTAALKDTLSPRHGREKEYNRIVKPCWYSKAVKLFWKNAETERMFHEAKV